MSRLAAWLGVAALFFVSVDLRLRRATQTPRWDAKDGTGYYRAESAFQFRHARLAAVEGSIPALDKDAQWPEGVDTRRETTTLMERVTAAAWRLQPEPRPDLRWFVVCWVAFVSSLSLLAFYAAGWRLTRDPPLALAATAAYGLSWAAQANVAGTYGFEGFALPVMHLGVVAALAALDEDSRDPVPWAFASGAALALAMSSWHFARLYLLSFLVALAWVVLRAGRAPAALKRTRLVAISAFGGALAAMIAVPAARPGGGSSLAHAWALLGEKLSRLLVKPADPASLSEDARLLWTGPFDSPEAAFAVFCLTPFALVLLPRLLSRRERGEAAPSASWALADALAALYAFAALLVSRLIPMAAFFAALAALRVAPKRRRLALVLLWAVAALEAFKLAAPASPLNPAMWLAAPLARVELGVPAAFRNERALLAWLKANAGPGKPALAGIGVSGSILAYADTPTLIHPKFEAGPIRRKVSAYLAALTGDERSLAEFCERHGAAFVVHATADLLDETDDGSRYLAGRLALREEMPLYRFHFKPGSLSRFALVYENPDFRVYAVGRSTAPWSKAPLPVYDETLFAPEKGPDGAIKLRSAEALARMHRARRQLVLAAMLARAGRHEEAVLRYDESASQWPPDPEYRADFEALRAALRKRPAAR